MKKLTIILTISISFFNCANDSLSDLTESGPLPNLVTYVKDVKPIMDNNCINCHGTTPINGANVSLVTYNQVKSAVQNNSLISRINATDPGNLMPQGGPKLPQNLIDTVIKWQTDGFVEN
ncbi:hypothetical protein [Gaetbulibacter aestuarii]|uniref:Cytochrome c domain-containing protein n=1 Tax=Gaetbulibacter aestuarii TaxID=1502358 RepID=A0ABW7MXG7_9FLAO